jgi:hypothetical protein
MQRRVTLIGLSHDLRQSDLSVDLRAAFFGAVRRGIGGVDLACIAYLGIVQLGLAYLLFTSAMARGVRSIDASIIGYIEPVLNPVWVFLFIGERPSGWALVGGAVIIASVIVHLIIETRSKAATESLPASRSRVIAVTVSSSNTSRTFCSASSCPPRHRCNAAR